MNKAEVKRQEEIEKLVPLIIECVSKNKGGSVALVPAPVQPHGKTIKHNHINYYVVSLDENYNPTGCTCTGGVHFCKHKIATDRHFAPILEALLNEEENPRFSFYRAGREVVARLSQFSGSEKAAYKAYKAAQERAAYNAIFDPNYNNVAA